MDPSGCIFTHFDAMWRARPPGGCHWGGLSKFWHLPGGAQGTPRDPKIDTKSIHEGRKWFQNCFRRLLGKDEEKDTITRGPWTMKIRLPYKRELNFHCSMGVLKKSQNHRKREARWLQDLSQSCSESSWAWPKKGIPSSALPRSRIQGYSHPPGEGGGVQWSRLGVHPREPKLKTKCLLRGCQARPFCSKLRQKLRIQALSPSFDNKRMLLRGIYGASSITAATA